MVCSVQWPFLHVSFAEWHTQLLPQGPKPEWYSQSLSQQLHQCLLKPLYVLLKQFVVAFLVSSIIQKLTDFTYN